MRQSGAFGIRKRSQQYRGGVVQRRRCTNEALYRKCYEPVSSALSASSKCSLNQRNPLRKMSLIIGGITHCSGPHICSMLPDRRSDKPSASDKTLVTSKKNNDTLKKSAEPKKFPSTGGRRSLTGWSRIYNFGSKIATSLKSKFLYWLLTMLSAFFLSKVGRGAKLAQRYTNHLATNVAASQQLSDALRLCRPKDDQTSVRDSSGEQP